MFPTGYFAATYFAPRYFPPGAEEAAPPVSSGPAPLIGGGGPRRTRFEDIRLDEDELLRKRRLRILQEDEELLELIVKIVTKGMLE